jgi:hypothetical protein
MRWLERHSYEDWMNDMATDDSKPARGWHAQWQPRCDCCGRFVLPGSPGSSWVNVPFTDINAGDERERCAACTKKHGPAKAMPGYVEHLVQGVVPDA